MAFKALDVITDALREIGACSAGEVPSAADASFSLGRLNDILDQWSARRLFAYSVVFQLYNITPNHQPHLIGPGLNAPDWAATQRPIKIIGANLVLNDSTPSTDTPIKVEDADWWNSLRTKAVTSDVPTHLYYSPDWPNGSVYLWPVPTHAYQVRLDIMTLLAQLANVDAAFSNPPGYKRGLMLTLAEDLCIPFQQAELLPAIAAKASKARAVIIGPNSAPPRISTTDSGQPGTKRPGGFNWRTGDIK